MVNFDLFQNSPLFSEERLYTEQIKIVYKIDYDYLLDCLKYVPYESYLEIRRKTILKAVNLKFVNNSEAAQMKFWERIVKKLEQDYGFQRPLSNSISAERMRRRRKNG